MIFRIACLVVLQAVTVLQSHAADKLQNPRLSLKLQLEHGPIKFGSKHRAEVIIFNRSEKPVYVCLGLSVIPNYIEFQKGENYQVSATTSGVGTWAGATPTETAQQTWEGVKLQKGEPLRFPIELPAPIFSGDIELVVYANLSVGQSSHGNLASWSKVELKTKQRVHIHVKP